MTETLLLVQERREPEGVRHGDCDRLATLELEDHSARALSRIGLVVAGGFGQGEPKIDGPARRDGARAIPHGLAVEPVVVEPQTLDDQVDIRAVDHSDLRLSARQRQT